MFTMWILERISDPVYTPADVRRLTGATAADLQNWANRGLVKPVANKPGKGGVRHYSKLQVAMMKIAKWLMPLRIETAPAMGIALECIMGAVHAMKFTVADSIERDVDIDPDAPGSLKYSDIIKSFVNSVALVKVNENGDFRVETRDMLEIKTTDLVEHALNLKPTLTIPVGILLVQIQREEKESGLADSLKERPSVKPTKKSVKRAGVAG